MEGVLWYLAYAGLNAGSGNSASFSALHMFRDRASLASDTAWASAATAHFLKTTPALSGGRPVREVRAAQHGGREEGCAARRRQQGGQEVPGRLQESGGSVQQRGHHGH